MKRWKLLLVALFFTMVCFVVYYFSHYRFEPDTVSAVDRPAKTKLTRPVRKDAVRSERAKKMIVKTDRVVRAVGMKSYRCVKNESFDEEAGILRKEIDSDCDGAVDLCRTEELNTYGEMVRYESYEDCGKVPTHCVKIDRNEYGEEIAYYIDSDCDGRLDECHTNERNDRGDIIEAVIDKGCDGVLEEGEERGCFSVVYDEDGLIITAHSGNCGEKPEICYDFEYDLKAGNRREKWDLKCDGAVDFCWVKFPRDDPDKWDWFIDDGCDGIWKSCTIYGDDGVVIHSFKGHKACAKKHEELVKRNLEKR